jgi:hypothetical protein
MTTVLSPQRDHAKANPDATSTRRRAQVSGGMVPIPVERKHGGQGGLYFHRALDCPMYRARSIVRLTVQTKRTISTFFTVFFYYQFNLNLTRRVA